MSSYECVTYEYPIPHLFHKSLLWIDTDCNIYFGFKLLSTDDWTFYSGGSDHNLLSGNILVNCGTSESDAQTNYFTTSKDSNGKVIAVLPANIQAKYARIYISAGDSVTIHEWRPSTYFTAHEIISGELTITDELAEAPLIKVVSSSIDRLKIGNIYDSTYGIIGFNDSSATIFELSDTKQQISGFEFTASTMTASGIKIRSGNQMTVFNKDGGSYAEILMGNDVTNYTSANIALTSDGTARFKNIMLNQHTVLRDVTGSSDINGTYISANTITARHMLVDDLSAISADLGEVNAGNITGVTITGGLFQTSLGQKKIIITNDGISLQTTTEVGNYGATPIGFLYGDSTKYGTGVRAYIHHANASVPFYIGAEASVADFHYFSRTNDPIGYGEVGDTLVSGGQFKLCTTATQPAVYSTIGPVKSAFHVTLSAEQTNIAVAASTNIIFDTEIFDIGNDFDTGTYTFTAPQDGKYQLDTNLYITSIPADATYLLVTLRTSNKSFINVVNVSAAITYFSAIITLLVEMDASDTAYVDIYQAAGTQQTDVNIYSHFSGYWVCD